MKKKLFKLVAHTVLLSLGYQLVFPVCAYALTTGPSQPEVQSFEPVGTTEMVDMFSGDFNYNIPLLDVEGYPVNIFYHSGVGMEQEASWVGLGWNINPGEINRTVRGLPDDFNGETIEKYTQIEPEQEFRVGLGVDGATELFGAEYPRINGTLGVYVSQNNYRGLSAGFNLNIGLSLPVASFGIGMGIGSQTGADKDIYASLSTPPLSEKGSAGISINAGTGYNSRSGLKDISLGANVSVTSAVSSKQNTGKGGSTETATKADASKEKSLKGKVVTGTGVSATIPVGIQNYVPVITNKIYQQGMQAQIKIGYNAAGFAVHGYLDFLGSTLSYDPKGSKSAYGYLYTQNSRATDILDFSREKDGVYNKTLQNLPASGMTYDIYTVNGNGAGGMFRPFRNDIGTIFDPYIDPIPESKQETILREGAFGTYGSFGDDISYLNTRNESGPWHYLPFSSSSPGALFEPVFFKQAGELTYNQQQETPQLFNYTAQYLKEDLSSLVSKGYDYSGTLHRENNDDKIILDNTTTDRSSRATNISFQTAYQAMRVPEDEKGKQIISYESSNPANPAERFYDPVLTRYNRYDNFAAAPGTTNTNAKAHHISEITQTMPDGRRYVYGIPAMNNITKEVTMAVDESAGDLNTGYVTYTSTQNSKGNSSGRDKFYSETITPAAAHSYLLTSLLSADYVDILGDGPTDDDLGTYVKYNYTRKNKDYRWKTPYQADKAQYSPGFASDPNDAKGNYVIGSREQWYIRTIESKNYVAEFYTSQRLDAIGVSETIKADDYEGLASDEDKSYKLDSIKLYNKHDRYINQDNAVPVKTVIFKYDYTLCLQTPNSLAPSGGKLTLKQIFIRYGNSQKNLLSPYSFAYHNLNASYNFAAKDRWGNLKIAASGMKNSEFPYTGQPDDGSDATLAAPWDLTDVTLPSGGKIHVDYESDDYSFVQNKRAMQMLKIEGVGNSKKMFPTNLLYLNERESNDYVYFKRRKTRENTALSLKDNYLEGQDLLYYSFALDITGTGKYEHIKGYAKIDEVGLCDDNTDYAYIKLKRDNAGDVQLHPAAILGINTARYYLPHIFYDGYTSGDIFSAIKNAAKRFPELSRTLSGENPFYEFLRQQKGRNLELNNCWIRIQTAGLTKKGGGSRVKQLTLSDNWNQLAGNTASTYGKKYDYTASDDRYGVISSGVASYEPMIGGDENPMRSPVPYSAEKGRGMPSVDFFQEEPFGESFFPPASVGYSSVKVTSIHEQYGRSSQAMDEYLFYTARDYPVIVSYTQKESQEQSEKKLFRQLAAAKVLQGYCIRMNDMHGKAKAINNYVLHKDGSDVKAERITGSRYLYNEDSQHQLSNMVKAVVRKRGTQNTFEIRDVSLGADMDFTVDSRQRLAESTLDKTMYNVNIMQILGATIPIVTLFKTDKTDKKEFRSLVSTKVIQQYGILKSIESIDHGAKTVTENLVYDAETGGVLLTRTNNEFKDYTCNVTLPAYLAYEGMRPAYTNDGYEEIMDSLVVNYDREGYLYTNNFDRFSDGDELLVDCVPLGKQVNKLWVTGVGVDTSKPKPVVLPDEGYVYCYAQNIASCLSSSTVNWTIKNIATNERINFVTDQVFSNEDYISCGTAGAYTTKLPVGDYECVAKAEASAVDSKTFYFTITKDGCIPIAFHPLCSKGRLIVYKTKLGTCPSLNSFVRVVVKQGDKIIVSQDLETDWINDCETDYYPLDKYLPAGWYDVYVSVKGPFAGTYGIIDNHPIEIKAGKSVARVLQHFSCGDLATDTYYDDISKGKPNCRSSTAKVTDPIVVNVPIREEGSSESTIVSRRCALKVVPRYKDKFEAATGTTNQSSWPEMKKVYTNVRVKVLRSGRRNNLNQNVQQTGFTAVAANFETDHMSSLDKLFNKTTKILNTGVNTFTDQAQQYAGFADEMTLGGTVTYKTFNDFVMGTRGTYRPLASYAPVAQRDYSNAHVRNDGTYSIRTDARFWLISNSTPVPETVCDASTDLFRRNTLTGTQQWKMASMVTRYDISGNALEEQDAIGNYSAAQYGYNKALPMSVAANARYQQFMFDGFEDYGMLLPEKAAALFLKGDIYSAFGLLFGDKSTVSTASFSRYGQNYHLREAAPSGSSLQVTQADNHSGYSCMKSTAAGAFTFAIGDAEAAKIGAFKLSPGKKYLLQYWVKSSNGTALTASMFKTSINAAAAADMRFKTGNIDNWYQLETVVDLSSVAAGGTVALQLPANVYIDDLRVLPVKSSMKSFVYDPVSFKLIAQLDENHMTTFFEYDQEGLLVRTKKETEKGIVTISESRRSNSKINN